MAVNLSNASVISLGAFSKVSSRVFSSLGYIFSRYSLTTYFFNSSLLILVVSQLFASLTKGLSILRIFLKNKLCLIYSLNFHFINPVLIFCYFFLFANFGLMLFSMLDVILFS